MSVQYQAMTNPHRLRWHFKVDPPRSLGSETVESGDLAVFIRRHPDADAWDDSAPQRQAVLGRFGLAQTRRLNDGDTFERSCVARAETVHEVSAFTDLWAAGQRCIVPIESLNKKSYAKRFPMPFRISAYGDEPLGAAGLWSCGRSRSSDGGLSFALLSINADSNSVMRRFRFQDCEVRMPLLLPKSAYATWINGTSDDCLALIEHCPAVHLCAIPMTSSVSPTPANRARPGSVSAMQKQRIKPPIGPLF